MKTDIRPRRLFVLDLRISTKSKEDCDTDDVVAVKRNYDDHNDDKSDDYCKYDQKYTCNYTLSMNLSKYLLFIK